MNAADLQWLFLALIALSNAVLGYTVFQRGKGKDDTKIGERLASLETRCEVLSVIPELQKQGAALAQADETFWKVIGPHMSNIIAHPNAINRDHLVNRLDQGTITYEQALALSSELGHAVDSEKDPMMRLAYAFKLAQTEVLLGKLDSARTEEAKRCQQITRTLSTG